MANQAIALQSRAPQSNFLGGAVQQNAQLINMMSQQRAAERQAAAAQQEMALARAAEGRAVTKAELDERKAQQEYEVAEVIRLRNRGVAVGDDAGYQMWLSQVEKVSPDDAAMYRQYSPTYDPDKMNNIIMEADKFIDKTIATPVASFQVGKDLKTYSSTVGGTRPGVTPLMVEGASDAAQPPMAEAPATGGVDARATQGAATAPSDLMQQGVDPRSIPMGNPLRPVSMTTGPQMGGQPDLAAVVQDMMSSGQISQANLQLMREMAGPDKDAQLAQILKANNIQIVPDAQPQMRSAVFRPGEDAAPQMQQVQATNAPGTQFRVAKDPMQSPSQAPGAAGAVAEAQREPIPQAGARAQAQREPIPLAGARAAAERASPAETAATESAKAQAQADVLFLEKYKSDRKTATEALNLIKKMIGDTYLENGRLLYKKGGTGPHPGFQDVVGATWRPGFRLIEGTDAFDFDQMLEQIKGSAFLTAYERLKGGGPIATVEGEKGTTAVTRVKRGLSEKGFVDAAREFEASVRDAIARADERYNRLKGIAKTPTTVDELIKRYGG